MRRAAVTSLLLLPLCAYGVNIISSNDDGWAEINIRELYDSLTSAGHSVVISAPAENQSGKGTIPVLYLAVLLLCYPCYTGPLLTPRRPHQ